MWRGLRYTAELDRTRLSVTAVAVDRQDRAVAHNIRLSDLQTELRSACEKC